MRKGFTLIELAIVLIIAGLILSLSVKSCVSAMESAKVDKTKDVLSTCKNKFLSKICNALIIKQKTCQQKDAWGNTIKVFIPESIRDKKPCSLMKARFSVKIGSKTYDNVVVLFLTSGKNRKIDSTITNSTAEIKGDDVADLITLNQLKASCCKGKILTIVTKELPPIVEGEDYEVGILVKGGTPPYMCSFKIGDFTSETSANSACYLRIPYQEVDKIVNVFSSQSYAPLDVTVTDSYGASVSKEFRVTVIKRFEENRFK